MPSIVYCPRCQTPARTEDAAGEMTACPNCGFVFDVSGQDEVIDVTAETPEGEIVGRPGPYSVPPQEPGRGRGPRGFRLHIERRYVSGPGCCGPGCLLFFLLFLFLLLRGC